MKYLVNIEEILSRDIIIEAENEDDAVDKVKIFIPIAKSFWTTAILLGNPQLNANVFATNLKSVPYSMKSDGYGKTIQPKRRIIHF